jgi:hypothetical protein
LELLTGGAWLPTPTLHSSRTGAAGRGPPIDEVAALETRPQIAEVYTSRAKSSGRHSYSSPPSGSAKQPSMAASYFDACTNLAATTFGIGTAPAVPK